MILTVCYCHFSVETIACCYIMKTLCHLKLMRGMGMLRRSLIVKPIMGRRVKEMSVASDGGIMAIYIGTMSSGFQFCG